MITPVVFHDCLYCGQPGAGKPRWSTRKVIGHVIIGYVHTECAQQEADAAQRRAKARQAKKWEQAGQQTLFT